MTKVWTDRRTIPYEVSVARLPAFLLLAVGLVGCSGNQADAGFAAESAVVSRGDLERQTLLTGELVAEDSAALVAPNVGIWPLQIRWLMEDGRPVAAGDKLIELDNSQLVSNLDEMRVRVIEAENLLAATTATGAASVDEASFAVERCRAQVAKAAIDAGTPESLLSELEVERRGLELSRAQLELAEAERTLSNTRRIAAKDYEIGLIALEQARARESTTLERIERLTLRAPRSGIFILSRNWQQDRVFENGDVTYPGMVMGHIPDLDTMIVQARLFDVDDGRILPGEVVTAALDAYPNTVYTGVVREISAFAEGAEGSSLRRWSRCVVDLDSIDTGRMLPGMSVKIVVRGRTLHNELLVARGAIRFDREGSPVVTTGAGDVPVEVVACNPQACAVRGELDVGTALFRPVVGEDR